MEVSNHCTPQKSRKRSEYRHMPPHPSPHPPARNARLCIDPSPPLASPFYVDFINQSCPYLERLHSTSLQSVAGCNFNAGKVKGSTLRRSLGCTTPETSTIPPSRHSSGYQWRYLVREVLLCSAMNDRGTHRACLPVPTEQNQHCEM